MKKKTLAQLDGIIGLVTGTILTILPIIIIMIASIFDNEEVVGVILGIIFIVFSLGIRNFYGSFCRNSRKLRY